MSLYLEMNNISFYKPKALNCERSQEWNLGLARGVQKVAEVTRCVIEGAEEISCINEAIAVGNKEQMWNLLQENIAKYKRLIRLLSPITKITVITVSKENITVADLRYQLQLITGFVLARNGLCGASKIAFKEDVAQVIETIL